jgi:2-C-methyl-D-erythritol 4-phosphate cytidylyltransferase
VDTIKEADPEGIIVGSPDRTRFWQAHTPQAFPASMLRRAYATVADDATDDAALVESIGGEVRLVDGGPSNLKVTRPEDVLVAEAILRARRAQTW